MERNLGQRCILVAVAYSLDLRDLQIRYLAVGRDSPIAEGKALVLVAGKADIRHHKVVAALDLNK